MSKKSSLGAAERAALVLRLLSKEERAAQIARRVGVSEATLFRWREQFIEGGAARVAGNGTPKAEAGEIERLKRALAKHDQVIGELTIANRLWGKVAGGRYPLTPAGRAAVADGLARCPWARVTRVLRALRVPASVWYHRPVAERSSPGPRPKPVPEHARSRLCRLARLYPWWGYQRIAVIARRQGVRVSNKLAYRIFREEGLLQHPRVRTAEVYQTARLFVLLPSGPNPLWQADVTYVHVPGHGWWYAVTVIDYFSRFLLACHFTPSYRAADITAALDLARAEAEKHHGPLATSAFLVTDNGPSFLARRFRQHISGDYAHVRINFRTPTQLGLLERFLQTLKCEEVYWRLVPEPRRSESAPCGLAGAVQHLPSPLGIAPRGGRRSVDAARGRRQRQSHDPARLADLGGGRWSEARCHDRRCPRPQWRHPTRGMNRKGGPTDCPEPFQPNWEPRQRRVSSP